MKKLTILLGFLFLFFFIALPASAKEFHGIDNPGGIPLYVIIEVEWNGDVNTDGSWTVYGPKWEPVLGGGTILSSCAIGPKGTCLAMNYDFKFVGKTVQFDEIFVDTVTATPQVRHIVLHDNDGDMTYTGSESAEHYFPWAADPGGVWPTLYFDRLDYDIEFDQEGNVEHFHYVQYEHKKLPNIPE